MRTALLRPVLWLRNTGLGAGGGAAALAAILIAIGFCATLAAYEKPFWYDEICTVIVCRLPGASEIWKALDHAADTNPPLFYFFARIGHVLIPDDHLGYRLPSILGLMGTVLCLYAILSRRVDRVSALVGAAFVLCTPLAAYGFEARPYALMVGCVSAAIAAWQRVEDSPLYIFGMAIALAVAVSLHYYAILVWPAFVVAEASVWTGRRRFRVGTWIALGLAAAPLLIYRPLLSHLRQYYGQNFWARSDLSRVFAVPSDLFNVGGYWGLCFTLGAIAVLVYWSLGDTAASGSPASLGRRESAIPVEDYALTVMLLLLPLIAIVAGKVSGAGMMPRYMLPAILGGGLAVGYLTARADPAVRALLLGLMLANYGLSAVPVMKEFVKGSLLENRMAATRQMQEILAGQHDSGLPVVISSGAQYLPMAYYLSPGQSAGLYALSDPPAAVKFANSDSVDLALLVLRQYFPLQVEDYGNFVPRHREFILISDGNGQWDWWPARLAHDGHRLRLVSAERTLRVYQVTLVPQTP